VYTELAQINFFVSLEVVTGIHEQMVAVGADDRVPGRPLESGYCHAPAAIFRDIFVQMSVGRWDQIGVYPGFSHTPVKRI
jgi:hypothetical protein